MSKGSGSIYFWWLVSSFELITHVKVASTENMQVLIRIKDGLLKIHPQKLLTYDAIQSPPSSDPFPCG